MYYFNSFKGFAYAELDLSQPLTVLIGANGSGKSNLIEGIELLSFLAQGGLLHDITELGRNGHLEVRGGLPSCAKDRQNVFSLGFKVKQFSYSITVYLLELFGVPGYSELKAIQEIRKRYQKAIEQKAMLFVSLPCIFELGNHIADVRDEKHRQKLANSLVQTIKTCVEKSTP